MSSYKKHPDTQVQVPVPPYAAESHHPPPHTLERGHERLDECQDVDQEPKRHNLEHQDECRNDDRPSKVVERTWYYDCDKDRDEHRQREHDWHVQKHHRYRDCDDDKRPKRPTRPSGVSTGRLGEGGGLTTGDINCPNPLAFGSGPAPTWICPIYS